MNSATGAVGAGGSSDCDGEDQEDSSSNCNDIGDLVTDLTGCSLNDESQNKTDEEDPLEQFRQQWQRELVATPSPQRQPLSSAPESCPELVSEPDTDEDKAKQLFLRGVEMERSGKLYEAVQHYKRAVQLLPDVEKRLYDSTDHRAETPEVELEDVTEVTSPEAPDSDEEGEEVEGDLVARLQRILARKGRLCEPEVPTKGGHMSWLPYDLVLMILRWVVGSELDAAALERAGAVCRGLYVAARDPPAWRAMCLRTWGIECGVPRALGYHSWRDMFVRRPRLRLDGCYISKTTYLRHGENSFQDQFYRPWYLIEYYRYLRFFPEGLVLMWTTPDEPAGCVGHLKYRVPKSNVQGILSGHYRLVGDKVVVVVRKAGDKKQAPTNTRFRPRRRDSLHEQHEQIYHLELELRSVRSRRNWQLVWRSYALCRARQWSTLELTPGRYPPFAFSGVRAYSARSEAPLV